jgi:hypothetical protein
MEWQEIGIVVMAIFGAAQAIVRLTPTPKDDKIVSKIGKILNAIFSATRTKK